ncbi:MAG: TVP38/TMEM64 family protein [Acetobacteraceae bacterium]
MSRRTVFRVVILLAVLAAVAAFFTLGLQQDLRLDALRTNEHRLLVLKEHNALLFAGAFLLLYAAMAALSLPSDIPLSLGAGALFGLVEGTALVSFASTIGATLAFLLTRFVFRDAVRQKFPKRVDQIDRGLQRGGGAYLLSLRLIPVIPFVLINILFGVTDFPVLRFYWISQLGMLPATIVYVNAGTQLERIHQLSDVLSPSVLVSLLLLAALPLAARGASAVLRRNQ